MAWLGRVLGTSPTKIPTRHAVARINAAVIFNRDAARHVATNAARLPTLPPPAPYHPPTWAAAPSDFGMKSEGAAAQVGRWYGAGTAEYGGMGGGIQDCMVHAYGGGVR